MTRTKAARAEVTLSFALFDTPLGRCGLAWSDQGVRALELPSRSDDETHRALLTRAPSARARGLDTFARDVAERVARHLSGTFDDLLTVRIDVELPPFAADVYACLRKVRPGEVVTYGELATRAGRAGAARAVGGALARNPVPIIVPCHRVVGGAGALCGFTAPGGLDTKRRLLALEAGARIARPPSLDDAPSRAHVNAQARRHDDGPRTAARGR